MGLQAQQLSDNVFSFSDLGGKNDQRVHLFLQNKGGKYELGKGELNNFKGQLYINLKWIINVMMIYNNHLIVQASF